MSFNKSNIIQLIIIVLITSLIGILINNLLINLIRSDMGISYNWIFQSSGFAISESTIPIKSTDSYALVLLTGWINSIKVIITGLILASLIGTLFGVCSISKNILLRFISFIYVSIARQVPLLIQLLFWYFVVLLPISRNPIHIMNSWIIISNQNISLGSINLSVEFSALVIGLSIFTGASIAEVIRGGINSVYKGQWEAYQSLGMSEFLGLRKIIFPQSLHAIIPGLTSQYLNLAKNTTLAIAIGYPDIYAISDTTITQTGRAIEGFFLLMASFLLINTILTRLMEKANSYIVNSTRFKK
tara:strand:- start:6094 stop:6996 length:903 start_codon:yes stop_codon:yes gene_type:complete